MGVQPAGFGIGWFHAHVGHRGGVVAHEDGRQARFAARRHDELRCSICGVGKDSIGDGGAVDDVGVQGHLLNREEHPGGRCFRVLLPGGVPPAPVASPPS